MIRLQTFEESFPLAKSFTISRGSKTEARVIRVVATDGEFQGQGECVPYARYGETPESVIAQISSLGKVENRDSLQTLMPAGAARNAVDCAIWDLEAKQSGKPVWHLAGLNRPQPVTTAYTLSLNDPAVMEEDARRNAHRPLVKVKLGTEDDIARLKAAKRGAPSSTFIVDANEGWSPESFRLLIPTLKELDIALVEQPLPEGKDEILAELKPEMMLCADDSSHTSEGLEPLSGRFSCVNIKLDKTGGLTEALRMKAKAEKIGLGIFVGCMVATSLSMAPAVLLAQGAKFVDLDGPLLLARDRPDGLRYDLSTVHPSKPELWG